MSVTRQDTQKTVGLFVTCLVDLFRPSVGFATISLLQEAGFTVEVPVAQTCCGQPAYNSGDMDDTRAVARQVLDAFEPFDYVVAPSGSCAAMLKIHYPGLFKDDPDLSARANDLAKRTFELVSFLADNANFDSRERAFAAKVTYHDSCSGLRELGISAQPRTLLKRINGLELKEMRESDICCGFGGTFCVKFSDISNAMVGNKCRHIEETGASLVLAGDMGCLLNMAGKLKRSGSKVEARHIAEILAGQLDIPAIGESDEGT